MARTRLVARALHAPAGKLLVRMEKVGGMFCSTAFNMRTAGAQHDAATVVTPRCVPPLRMAKLHFTYAQRQVPNVAHGVRLNRHAPAGKPRTRMAARFGDARRFDPAVALH